MLKPDVLLDKRQGPSALGGDIFRLYGLARYSRALLLVEIGVGIGASTAALLLAAQENGGQLISIDKERVCASLFIDESDWKFVQADARDPSLPDRLGLQTIPFLFLDTSHIREDTEQELQIWMPRIEMGGLVVFHDVKSYRQGVWEPISNYIGQHQASWVYHETPDSCHGLGVAKRV